MIPDLLFSFFSYSFNFSFTSLSLSPSLSRSSVSSPENRDFSRYNLEKNNAILGREEDESLCEDLRRKYEVSFTAGGSTQNAIRVAQWVMKEEKSTVFLGTIGDDDFGRLLKERILEDGVEEAYVVDKERSTGRCVVMLSDGGSNRSLVSFHGAARMFDPFHLYQRWSFVQRSKVIYSAGFTLAANYEAIIQLASHAATCHPLKIFSFNLSATYVSSNHSLPLLSLLPFIDILFGNDTEALALSHALRWEVSFWYFLLFLLLPFSLSVSLFFLSKYHPFSEL